MDKQRVMGAAAEASEPALLASLPEPVPVSASGDGQAQGRERIQRAWDGLDSLPPIEFTDAEAAHLLAAQPTSGEGWVFFNEDTGEEYSRNHPVESGEVPDATVIRRSTAQEDTLHAAYQREWQRANAALEASSRQEERLRRALIDMGRQIPGVILADDVSTDFLMLLPGEMRGWLASPPHAKDAADV